MPDPISPVGSPGQLPAAASALVVSSTNSATENGGQVGSASEQSKAVPVKPTQESALVELRNQTAASVAKAISKSEGAPSLEESVKAFRDFLKNLPSDLQFKPDEESGIVIFKLVNPVTKEVIRQYPADEVVQMARKLKALEAQNREKSGIFLDQRT